MSSGIIHDATIRVGKYSQYSVGRPWASGEGVTKPIVYGFIGWREDACSGPEWRPLAEVIARVIEVAREGTGGWVERRAPTRAWLREHPFEPPRWADGLDWTMGAWQCAWWVLGSHRAADGLLEQPEFREAWLASLREDGGYLPEAAQ